MTTRDDQSQPSPSEAMLRERLLDGEVTIYDPRSEQAAFLNRTATVVWELADGDRDEEQIAIRIAEEFSQDPALISAQIATVLDELHELGLLDQRNPPRRRS